MDGALLTMADAVAPKKRVGFSHLGTRTVLFVRYSMASHEQRPLQARIRHVFASGLV